MFEAQRESGAQLSHHYVAVVCWIKRVTLLDDFAGRQPVALILRVKVLYVKYRDSALRSKQTAESRYTNDAFSRSRGNALTCMRPNTALGLGRYVAVVELLRVTLLDVDAVFNSVARIAIFAGAVEASWSVGAVGIDLRKNKGGRTGRQELLTTVLQIRNRLQ